MRPVTLYPVPKPKSKPKVRASWKHGKPLPLKGPGRGNHGNHVTGNRHPRWTGGRHLNHGYMLVHDPSHPRADVSGYVREHIKIVEAALGKSLPPRAEVHHINQVKSDNRNANLVLCEDAAYHQLLHRRMRAKAACGHCDWIRCQFCQQWGPLGEVYMPPSGRGSHYHRVCARVKDAKRRWKRGQPFRGPYK